MSSIKDTRKELDQLVAALKQSDMADSMVQESIDMLIVEAAVAAANDFLMEFADGSIEHIDMLTAEVAEKFASKVLMAQKARRNRQLLLELLERKKV